MHIVVGAIKAQAVRRHYVVPEAAEAHGDAVSHIVVKMEPSHSRGLHKIRGKARVNLGLRPLVVGHGRVDHFARYSVVVGDAIKIAIDHP